MKPAPRRIVCATDFSPNARSAADVAAAMARRLGSTCELVHVADEFHAHVEGTNDFRRVMRSAAARLRGEARRLRTGGARVEEVLLHGRPAEAAIEGHLAARPPSFSVVSSVSKSAFDRWTLGSVSEHVTEHAEMPTLVVRAPERLLAPMRGARRLQVVVAFDFTVSSEAALAWLPQLQRMADCDFTLVHIHWPPDDARGAALRTGRAVRALRRKMKEAVGGGVVVRLEQNWGRADAALVHAAREMDADLVVVGTHQRRGVGRVLHPSFSRGLLRHAPCNVFCVPTPFALKHGLGPLPRADRVLAATDLTSTGDQAIPWAYAVVARGGVVKLVHVVESWTLPSPLLPRYDRTRKSRKDQRQLVAEVRRRLAALAPPGGGPGAVRTEVGVLEDDRAARAIILAAQQFEASIVCLSAGMRSTTGAWPGPVVRQVIEQNPGPVLVVPPKKE